MAALLMDTYLLTGEIPMHLLYGFDPLVGQDALKHRMKNYQTPKLRGFQMLNQTDNSGLDTPYLSYLIQDNIKRFLIHVCRFKQKFASSSINSYYTSQLANTRLTIQQIRLFKLKCIRMTLNPNTMLLIQRY